MNPFILLALAAGVLLLYYAFTGNSPLTTIKSVLPAQAGTKPAK